jgi:RHS repeat-associated protein
MSTIAKQYSTKPAIAVATFIVLLLSAARSARACTATVTSSLSGTTLTIQASSAGGQCGGSSIAVAIDGAPYGMKDCWAGNATPTCNATWQLSTACMTTGTHTVTATAACWLGVSGNCNRDSDGIKTSTFTIDATPTVGVTYQPSDSLGHGRFIVPYNFPNTTDWSQRKVEIYLDDSIVRRTDVAAPTPILAAAQGTWEPDFDTSCLRTGTHAIRAVATSCGRDRVEQSSSLTVNTTPTVGITYAQDASGGRLLVPYSFPNTSNRTQRRLNVYNGAQLIASSDFAAAVSPVEQQSGQWEIGLDTACWNPGSYNLRAVATACGADTDPDYSVSATTALTVISKPTISLAVATTASGEDAIDVTYSFPAKGSRSILLSVDGGTSTLSPTDPSGMLTIPVSSCWREAHAIAVSCGKTDDANFTASAKLAATQNKPTVSITLQKGDLDPATGQRLIEATLTYDLKKDVPNAGVTVTLLSWTDATGQEFPGGPLYAVAAPPLSGTATFTFLAPNGARQVRVHAVAVGCWTETSDYAIDCASCDGSTGNPVYLVDGDMHLSDSDPLPPLGGVMSLSRAYDSDEQASGLFGRGWTSYLDQRSMIDLSAGLVSVVTASNEVVTFQAVGGGFVQTWPTSRSNVGNLTSEAGAYVYRAPGARAACAFRSSDGRLAAVRDVRTGRAAIVSYDANGLPSSVTDSWTAIGWTLTMDATHRRVLAVDVPSRSDLHWSYTYDSSGNLIAISGPGGNTWRTYEYSNNRMTASRDALGNLIESHTYDANGYAISSTGDSDEIASIQYNLPSENESERITRVTEKNGNTTDYVLRSSGGANRPVRIDGGCASCGSRDTVTVRDEAGRPVREQGADGFITTYEYANGSLEREEHFLQPEGCVPSQKTRCRLDPDSLAETGLEETAATTWTRYEYGDAHWPDRPTAIIKPSVLEPDEERREELVYDAGSGAERQRTMIGLTVNGAGTATRVVRRVTSTFYGDDGVGLAPAFEPGGSFQSAWLNLPQPMSLLRSSDGARDDVPDVALYVYYPIDASVPSELRGQLAAVKNAAGHVIHYDTYDVFGRVTRTIDANGVVTEIATDGLGRSLHQTVKGVVNGCDGSVDPLCGTDLVSIWSYFSVTGPLQSQVLPGGGTTVYTYDDRGRRQTISRGPSDADLRERIELTYDALTGKVAKTRYLAMQGGTWTEKRHDDMAYDAFKQLQAVTHADGSSARYTYDRAGRLVSTADENHTIANTLYGYDSAGRLTTTTKIVASAAGTRVIVTSRYAYNTDGQTSAVTDANGNTATYDYDDFGALVRQESPVTGTTVYQYDNASNLTATRDANGGTTSYTYDPMNRLLQLVAASGSASETVTRSYDDPTTGGFGIGRPASMTDPAGATTFKYDRRGLLLSETRIPGGATAYVTSYGYDRDGNRTVVRYPSGATAIDYDFDYADRPVAARRSGTTLVSGVQYLPFGPLIALAFGNGTLQSLQYDTRYRLTRNTLSTLGTSLADYGYAYDAASNIIQIADLVTLGYSRTFYYDDLNRLTGTGTGSELWRSSSYAYDDMGNMISMIQGVENNAPEPMAVASKPKSVLMRRTLFTYVGNLPKLSEVTEFGSSRPVGYDAMGNETHSIVDRAYSPRNLLASIEQTDEPGAAPHRLAYGYDGRGVRVVRTENPVGSGAGAARLYFYSPELRLLASTNDDAANFWDPSPNSGATSRNFRDEIVWFGERPIAQITPYTTGSTVRYTFADHLLMPLLQTDSSGAIVWRVEYEPFGNVHEMRNGARNEQPLRFPGQEFSMSWSGADENYNVFRWYRTGWGRYTQADPIGLLTGQLSGLNHLYAYADARPINSIDPRGLFATSGCTPDEAALLKAAAQLAGDAIADGKCLGCSKKKASEWKNKINSTTYHCLSEAEQQVLGTYGPSTCGFAGTPQATYTGKDVTFTQNGLTNHNGNPFLGCGCMQGALLHEIAHLMGYPDGDTETGAKGLAYKCIPCAQNPNSSVLDPPPTKGWKD